MNVERARSWKETYQAQPQVDSKRKVRVVVRRKSWLTKGEKILYSLISIALVIACYYIVSFSAQTDQMNRDIQHLEQTIDNQRVHNENLQFKIDELSKPDRIMTIAEKLGLKIQDTKVRRAKLINE